MALPIIKLFVIYPSFPFHRSDRSLQTRLRDAPAPGGPRVSAAPSLLGRNGHPAPAPAAAASLFTASDAFCLNLLISPPCCSNLIASLLFNSENCFRKSLYVKTRSYVPFCSASCFPAQNLLLLPRREHRGAAPTPQRAGQQRAYRALLCWAPEKASFKAFVSI